MIIKLKGYIKEYNDFGESFDDKNIRKAEFLYGVKDNIGVVLK